MRLTLTGALKQKESRKKLGMFSKAWTPGTTWRVFYPIEWCEETNSHEFVVGGIWGYNVNDMKELGIKTTFIPALMGVSENGELIGNMDITGQFAAIAPIFVEGAKERETANIAKTNFPSEELRKEALKKVEEKYNKESLDSVKPVISKLNMKVSIEALMVPIVNGVLQVDKAVVVSQPLSTKKGRALQELLTDIKYKPNQEDEFFEVEYNFPMSQKKSESGNASTISGLTPEYRSSICAPDNYMKLKSMLDALAHDADTIVRHCTSNVDESKIRQCITSYAFMHAADLEFCTETGTETLCKNVNIINELSLLQSISSGTLKDKLTVALAEISAEPTTDTVPEAVLPENGAPSVDSLINTPAVSEAQEDEMMDNMDFNIGTFN